MTLDQCLRQAAVAYLTDPAFRELPRLQQASIAGCHPAQLYSLMHKYGVKLDRQKRGNWEAMDDARKASPAEVTAGSYRASSISP